MKAGLGDVGGTAFLLTALLADWPALRWGWRCDSWAAALALDSHSHTHALATHYDRGAHTRSYEVAAQSPDHSVHSLALGPLAATP